MFFFFETTNEKRLFYICGSARILNCLIGILLFLFLRRQRHLASIGDTAAARSLILPMYQPLILLSSFLAFMNFFLIYLTMFQQANFCIYIYYFLGQFGQVGFTHFFMSRSLSRPAIMRACTAAVLWGCHAIVCALVISLTDASLVGLLLLDVVPIVFFARVYRMKTRRRAVVPYALFMMCYYCVWIVYNIIDTYAHSIGLHYCALTMLAIVEIPRCPLIYYIMLSDTNYWRTGCTSSLSRRSIRERSIKSYKPAVHVQQQQPDHAQHNAAPLLEAQTNNSELPPFLNFSPPLSLLTAPDSILSSSLQTLIESNSKNLIDFAYITISDKCLGYGSSSRVFAGTYKQHPVAIKFFVSDSTLTKETVNEYIKETSIAAALKHENIINFYGLCVQPPSLFMVVEYCAYGSLFDCLPRLKHCASWTYQAILYLALQATRALEYLHGLGCLHRDIKSLNYLIDANGTLKLIDFGLSKMFPKPQASKKNKHKHNPPSQALEAVRPHTPSPPLVSSSTDIQHRSASQDISIPYLHNENINLSYGSSRSFLQSSNQAVPEEGFFSQLLNKIGVSNSSTAVPCSSASAHLTRRVGTRCWMSPEMFYGAAYNQSSDIYSLTTVLWEILTCMHPYELESDAEIEAMIVSGLHPPIPEQCPHRYREILEAGWCVHANLRPSASDIRCKLEDMLNEYENFFHLPKMDVHSCTTLFQQSLQFQHTT